MISLQQVYKTSLCAAGLSTVSFIHIPCSLQDHASEFEAVTNLSKFGYFPVGQKGEKTLE